MNKPVWLSWMMLPLMVFGVMTRAEASFWDDLWYTKNQQAQALMSKHRFADAEARFEDPSWRATAAFRSGHYDKAADGYKILDTDDGYYNQGNALAHMGQYEKAIKAYDNALRLNSHHQDAAYNRKIVAELIKKDKQKQANQDKQNQDKQNQDKQNQDKQNQDKQNQDKHNQDKQNQDKQNQDKHNQDKQNQDKQNQDKQNQDKQNQDKQNQDKQNQDKQNQDKQNQDKQNQNKQNQAKQKQNKKLSVDERERQRAKEQWLRLVPDDPGGLLRQKFLRDHLRRERGWDQ